MSFKITLTASVMMISAFVFNNYISLAENVHPNKPFSAFPKQFDKWVGTEARFDEEIYEKLGVDDSFLGNYYTADHRQVQLYVGFYQSQREGDIIHSPRNCMSGSGWNIIRTSKITLPNPASKSGKFNAAVLILQNGREKQVALYWFQSRGRFISSEYMQKIYLVIDSITRHRTDGSFVRLIATVKNDNEETALKNLTDFAKLIIPALNEHIPS
jgi:EpsI family protein